jgi:hypothetical protein
LPAFVLAASAAGWSTFTEITKGAVDFPAGYVNEAPLPEGFPPPSEVGKVVEKEYPLARSFYAAGSGAFMKCFAYLAKQKHEMTAPVVVEYQPNQNDDKPRTDFEMPVPVERMHFMLGRIAQDEPKQDGPVTVADMPRQRVLSIAFQGRLTEEVIKGSEAKLREHLAGRKDLKAAAASPRILGYNGPTVAPEKVYWEIQLPVEAAASQ